MKNKSAKIPPAGQRKDEVRKDTNAPLPSRDSLEEAIKWRKEHRQ